MKNKIILLCLTILLSCNSNDPSSTQENVQVSECGGFSSFSGLSKRAYQRDSSTYCNAEMLYWFYDDQAKNLEILHTRRLWNCAAKIQVTITKSASSYKIIEKNSTDVVAKCMCYFDTYCEISTIEEGKIMLLLEAKEFLIDLGLGKGNFTIDTTKPYPCM